MDEIQSYAITDIEGTILRTYSGPQSMAALQLSDGEFMVRGAASDVTQYVDIETDELVDKPAITAVLDKAQIVADGTDTATLSGLPVPCTVTLEGVAYSVPDGVFQFTLDLPGVVSLKVSALHYLDWEGSCEGTAPV